MYAVSAFGPGADLAFRNVIAIRFGRTTVGEGPGASAAHGATTLCQEDYYIRLFDLLPMVPMFHAVFHACHGGRRPGRFLESDDSNVRKVLQKEKAMVHWFLTTKTRG